MVTFCPQAATSTGITSASTFQEGAGKEPEPFPLTCLCRDLPTCSQADLPLDLTGQSQPGKVRLFDGFSSVLILRPGMALPLWSQGYSTGCVKKLKFCGQRSLCGQRRLCVWSGHGFWAGTLACFPLGGEDWFGAHCSRLISR